MTRNKSGKQDSPESIMTCVQKLPKAVVYIADSCFNEKERIIVIPVTVFSGQFFVAGYDGDLKVDEVTEAQYAVKLDSDSYTYHHPYPSRLTASGIFDESHTKKEGVKNSPLAETARVLSQDYLIDFVSKIGLERYLKRIDKDVEEIDVKLWEVGG